MKQIRTTFLLCSMSFAGSALAQGPASRGATADVAAQALPCAAVPAVALVPPPEAHAGEQAPSIREVVAFDANTPDEPAVAEEIEQESAEMEELRQAEEAAKVRDATSAGRRAGRSARTPSGNGPPTW